MVHAGVELGCGVRRYQKQSFRCCRDAGAAKAALPGVCLRSCHPGALLPGFSSTRGKSPRCPLPVLVLAVAVFAVGVDVRVVDVVALGFPGLCAGRCSVFSCFSSMVPPSSLFASVRPFVAASVFRLVPALADRLADTCRGPHQLLTAPPLLLSPAQGRRRFRRSLFRRGGAPL